MATAISDGLRIQYTDSGSGGTPVLLLSGLGSTVDVWAPLMPVLERSHRVICPAPRGIGGSEIREGGLSIADLADDAGAVLDAAGVDSVHVIGNSLGGMIAQEFALRHPERVRSLTLAATTPGLGALPAHPALAWHLLCARRVQGAERRRHLDLAFHGPATVVDAPERLNHDGDKDNLPLTRATCRHLRAAVRWSSLRRLRSIAAPTLVMHGTHDRLFPAANGRLLARLIPGARFALLPRVGHLFITDAGDLAGQLMARFVAGVDARHVVPAREQVAELSPAPLAAAA